MKKPLDVAMNKLKDAGLRLEEGVFKAADDLAQDGVIQRFEFTFEQLWKTLKIFMEEKGDLDAKTPKDSLKAAFRIGLIENSEEKLFLDMLNDRNTSSHVYNKEEAAVIYGRIRNNYLTAIKDLICRLGKKINKPEGKSPEGRGSNRRKTEEDSSPS